MKKYTLWIRIVTISITVLVLFAGMAAQRNSPPQGDHQPVAQDDQPTPENPIEEPPDPVNLPEIPDGEVEDSSGISTWLILVIIAAGVVLLLIGWVLGRQANKPESQVQRPAKDEE
jgi:hypothetical protein